MLFPILTNRTQNALDSSYILSISSHDIWILSEIQHKILYNIMQYSIIEIHAYNAQNNTMRVL